MSLTNGVTSATTSAATLSTTAQKNQESEAMFLDLLLEQLRNQDPTKPTDPGEFLSQLASFTAVEQQIKTNESLAALMTAGQASQAAGIIGATVASQDRSVSGVVASVTMGKDGLIANLENGHKLTMGAGTHILKAAD